MTEVRQHRILVAESFEAADSRILRFRIQNAASRSFLESYTRRAPVRPESGLLYVGVHQGIAEVRIHQERGREQRKCVAIVPLHVPP